MKKNRLRVHIFTAGRDSPAEAFCPSMEYEASGGDPLGRRIPITYICVPGMRGGNQRTDHTSGGARIPKKSTVTLPLAVVK